MANFPTALPPATPTAATLAAHKLDNLDGAGLTHSQLLERHTLDIRGIAVKMGIDGADNWTTYTPVWDKIAGFPAGTAPAIGNGTLAGRYRLDGKHVEVFVTMKIGSTTTTGALAPWKWSLPTFVTGINAVQEHTGTLLIMGTFGIHYQGIAVVHGLLDGGTSPEIRCVSHQSQLAPIAISAGSVTSGITTFTVPTGHGLFPGMPVTLSGMATNFNGEAVVIDIPTTTTFRVIAQAAASGSSGAGTCTPHVWVGANGSRIGTSIACGWDADGVTAVPARGAFANTVIWAIRVGFDLA